MYQDGNFIGESETIIKFNKEYKIQEHFYIGVGNPTRELIPNWFNGSFEYFAYYDTKLSEDEIIEITNNTEHLLNKNFGKYISCDYLKTYYDSEFIRDYTLIDLSNNFNLGKIINCEIAENDKIDWIDFNIPHRKPSTFKSINHENNGFNGNRWKTDNTRWNQLRLINEVMENSELTKDDGLSNLNFAQHNKRKMGKDIQIITVGI
jgi:hypothetical protein